MGPSFTEAATAEVCVPHVATSSLLESLEPDVPIPESVEAGADADVPFRADVRLPEGAGADKGLQSCIDSDTSKPDNRSLPCLCTRGLFCAFGPVENGPRGFVFGSR